jgi:hypothetical protein
MPRNTTRQQVEEFQNIYNSLLLEEISIKTTDKYISTPIIGLNTHKDLSEKDMMLVLASAPVLEVTPLNPSGLNGSSSGAIRITSFDSSTGYNKYEKILKSVGVVLNPEEKPIRIAFQPDSPIVESFGNEYTESMFDSLLNAYSPMGRELKHLSGENTLSGIMEFIKKGVDEGTGNLNVNDLLDKSSLAKSGLNVLLQGSSYLLGKATDILSSAAGFADSFTNENLRNMLLGANLDFPLQWAGTSYMPSYTVRIRLTNPDPMNDFEFIRNIYRPLAMLLGFVMPYANSNSTYDYPVYCSVNCPGMFEIKAGAVQSIEVVKGIDNIDFTYSQRINSLDVTITFIDLYSSIVAVDEEYELNNEIDPFRPTFKSYMVNTLGKARYQNNIVERNVYVRDEESGEVRLETMYEYVDNLLEMNDLTSIYQGEERHNQNWIRKFGRPDIVWSVKDKEELARRGASPNSDLFEIEELTKIENTSNVYVGPVGGGTTRKSTAVGIDVETGETIRSAPQKSWIEQVVSDNKEFMSESIKRQRESTWETWSKIKKFWFDTFSVF